MCVAFFLTDKINFFYVETIGGGVYSFKNFCPLILLCNCNSFVMLTSNSDESNFVICCCRSWLRPGTRTTSVCMFLPLFVLLSSLLRFRFRGVLVLESASSRPPTMSPPESSLARSSKPAEANKWRLLVASLLFTPPLASLPIDDHSSLVEMVLAQQIWKKKIQKWLVFIHKSLHFWEK